MASMPSKASPRTKAQQTAAEQIRASGGFAHDDDDEEEEEEDAGEGLGTRVTAGIRSILGKMKQPAAGGTRK